MILKSFGLKIDGKISVKLQKISSFDTFQVIIFSSSSPLVFFLYSRAERVISQISQSRQRTLTLILENRRGYFSRTFSLFTQSFSGL